MDTESFFTKLRRLGTTVESETARLEENMKKPIGLRSSGSGRSSRSSNLILKEMQHEAKNVKVKAFFKVFYIFILVVVFFLIFLGDSNGG